MEKYVIPQYEDYELHYSTDEQLVYSKRNEKYLKLNRNKGGYLRVSLYKNKKGRTFKLHRLVWMTLKGEIPQGLEINHIDENKENNSIENLELVTHKENNNYGTHNARSAKARSIPIVAIKKDLSEILHYPSAKEAERDKEKGFHNSNISQCCLNKLKSHKDFIWFFKSDFEEYMNRFQGNLEKVIKYKKSISK